MPRGQGWYHTMDEIHGDMMIGPVGDYLLETTASLTILMIITGIYLWWAKQRSLKSMLMPKAGKRDAHGGVACTNIWFLGFFDFVAVLSVRYCLGGNLGR